MDLSKLTTKYQATIPRKIRNFLSLGKGDVVRFTIENDRVTVQKAQSVDRQFAKFTESTLEEWNSCEDDEAFNYL